MASGAHLAILIFGAFAGHGNQESNGLNSLSQTPDSKRKILMLEKKKKGEHSEQLLTGAHDKTISPSKLKAVPMQP